MAFFENPFRAGTPLIRASTSVDRNGRFAMTVVVYLIAAAVILCACLFFFARVRARSRD
jgi:hypothetical protein